MKIDLVKREFEGVAGDRLTFVSAQLFDKDRRLEIAAQCHCPHHRGKTIYGGIKGSGNPIADDELPSLVRELVKSSMARA